MKDTEIALRLSGTYISVHAPFYFNQPVVCTNTLRRRSSKAHHSLLTNNISCVSWVAHTHCRPVDNLKQGHLSTTFTLVNFLSCSQEGHLSPSQLSGGDTFAATYNLRVAIRSNMHVLGLWEEAAGENRENMALREHAISTWEDTDTENRSHNLIAVATAPDHSIASFTTS